MVINKKRQKDSPKAGAKREPLAIRSKQNQMRFSDGSFVLLIRRSSRKISTMKPKHDEPTQNLGATTQSGSFSRRQFLSTTALLGLAAGTQGCKMMSGESE